MVADTYNITSYGLCPCGQKWSSSQPSFVNGDATVTLSSGDWNAVAAGSWIFVESDADNALYYAYRVASKNASPTIEIDGVFGGTTGSYNCYFAYGSFAGAPRTLGDMTSYRKSLEVPIDRVGMPRGRYNKAYQFDMDGTDLTIEIEGFWKDVSAGITAHSAGNAWNIEWYALTSIKYEQVASFFWNRVEVSGLDSAARAYPVNVTNMTVNYDVSRKTATGTFALPYKITMRGRKPDGF